MDLLIVLAKLCPSLPIMLKSSNAMLWPVFDWFSKMVKVYFKSFTGCPSWFPNLFPHNNPTHCICTNIWPHFSVLLCPFPWMPLICTSIFCHFWSMLVFHVGYIGSWCFHLCLLCRVWQCVLCICLLVLCCWKCWGCFI